MPRLTDQEMADVLRHLEADKPLPDQYRFLTFDNKREFAFDVFRECARRVMISKGS
jgi:hypothetical protein